MPLSGFLKLFLKPGGRWNILHPNSLALLPLNKPVIVVQSLSHVWFFVAPWNAARQASLSLTIPQSTPKFMSIEMVMPSNHLIPYYSLLLLPSIFPSIGVFSNKSAVHIRCQRIGATWSKNQFEERTQKKKKKERTPLLSLQTSKPHFICFCCN